MLKLENICKTYITPSKTRDILTGCEAVINEGEFVTIYGQSGSGKSTLLNIIGGLDREYTGKILLNEQELAKLSDNKLSRLRGSKTGFVFQTPNFLNHLSCIKNLSFAAKFSDGSDNRTDLVNLLEKFGLGEFVDSSPEELSGGQKQRLALSRALVGNPDLLLCDEPTGNLDERTGEKLIEELQKINKKGKTLIVVSHDARMMKVSDKVFTLKDGTLVEAKS